MRTSGTSIRVFFAVFPDPETRDRIAGGAAMLPLGPDGRLVPVDNYHLTVAFVGQVAAERIPALLDIGSRLRGARFDLRLDSYEYWPKQKAIVAAARAIPSGLVRLWRDLHSQLAESHGSPDAERFRPHVTLARKVSQPPVLQAMSPVEWSASAWSLVRSDTGGKHSAYTVVDTWPLLDESEDS